MRRTKGLAATIASKADLRVNVNVIIGWQEVDRLVEKGESAAALLVAAVNVESILWEHLRRSAPATALTKAPHEVRSIWGKIQANQDKTVTLSSLLRVAEYVAGFDTFTLSPTWDPIVSEINEARNKIAHERGYFALLTQLKDPTWPEARIRQVLESAKEFCHGNAP
ncbi:MAG: hypothetical protein NTY63_09340 [Candidatus Bipolaricaulota bacterium]|nr:hypothetical protein [Candidatus Bipolaricaulota bacterium]